jgi:hypothetical protein
MTLEATIVAQTCLPSVLAILMDLELVPSRAVNNLQDIQVTASMGLPSASATTPSRIKWNGTAWSTLQPIKLSKRKLIKVCHNLTIIPQVENVKGQDADQQADDAKEPSKAIGCMEHRRSIPRAKHEQNERTSGYDERKAKDGICESG